MVDVKLGSVETFMNASPAVQADLVESLSNRLRLAATDRQAVVALRPVDFVLSYDQLGDRDRASFERIAGKGQGRERYETTIASLFYVAIQKARSARPDLRVSVVGLPLEPDEQANRLYMGVINQLSAFVASRTFGASSVTPPRSISTCPHR
jgi:hypothetical protein